MIVRTILIGLILFPIAAFSQYEEVWQVPQEYYDYGIAPFDYNDDGADDLTKLLGNNISMWDGTDNFTLMWSITADAYDLLTLWDEYELGDGSKLYVFEPYNSFEQYQFTLRAYEPLGEFPLWSTSTYLGEMSFMDGADLDGDGELELVFGQNHYLVDDENYESRFRVISAANGSLEFDSGTLDGYMMGPYLGDMNGDGLKDIVINLYDLVNETSSLSAWQLEGTQVVPQQQEGNLLPNEIELGANYPNPFNPSTMIPLLLQRPAEVEINVVNTLGQRVTQLMSGRLGAGQHQFTWNGRDENGRRAASGLYFYEVITDGHRVQRPMVLLK